MKLHPWNTDFSWERNEREEYLILDDNQVNHFHEQGFVLLENALDLDLLTEVTNDLDAIESSMEDFLRTLPDERLSIAEADAIVFSIHAVAVSEAARKFAQHPVFGKICHDLVGDNVRLYWDQLVYKKPAKPRPFPWHQDNGYTFVEPQQYLTCWIPLVDATVENGCPWVAPGKHVHGTLAHSYVDPLGYQCFEEPEDAVPVPAARGSVVIFSSLTPHATGPNTSDSVRKAYILQYAPEGAMLHRGEPHVGPSTSQEVQSDQNRQFPVIIDGLPVSQ